ncbi:MAG: serine/threonine-protein kinase [Candidatus Eisenbacteria bacterium]
MADDRWSRLRELFERVRALSPEARAAVLEREVGNDAALQHELAALLKAHDESAGFLAERPVPGIGTTVGPYTLIEPIGEGGFAVVYLAEQVVPLRRRVALKLIKPGMDSRQVIARFEAERQALALMDHPGIAQVFDAGETEAGRPFFAMEHVAGAPITAFADAEQLTLRERLQLFLQVCDAIQHAHQKGVIHRDIKPSNVLVARRDGVPAPKVIDFGIAKATGEASLGGPAMTREGMIVGTAGYMSPEQLGAIRAPVDTRSDLYSLGVLLYELLAGDLPYDRERLRSASWPEAMQIVLADPPTPAERAARGGTAETAGRRSTHARALVRALRGELEWITLRALEREPDRRYASVAELAADIRRHLADEPVSAAAPGALYRLRKFARRHRVGVAAAGVVLLVLVAGGVAAGIGFGRAVRAERAARREAESAKQVSEFLVGLFHASSPGEQGDSLTAHGLLDRGLARLESAPPSDPLVRARVLGAISDSYLNLDEFEAGLRAARTALAAARSARPRDDVEVARYLDKLANGFSMAGATDSIPPLVDQAIALLSARPGADPSLLASCWYRKSRLRMNAGATDEADSLIAVAIAVANTAPKPDPALLTRIHSTRATLASWRSRFDLALTEDRLALGYALEAAEPMRAAGLHSGLASVFLSLGKPDSALVHAQLGVDMSRKLYAPEHRSLAVALGRLAEVQVARGRHAEAVDAEEAAVRILRTSGKPGEQLAFELAVLGDIYRTAGQLERALRTTREALGLYRAVYGIGHYRVGETMGNLASYEMEAGHLAAADTLFRGCIAVLEANHDESIALPAFRLYRGNLCLDREQLVEADTLFSRAWAGLDSTNAATRGYCGDVLLARARVHVRQGRADEAESLAAAGMRLRRGELAATDPQLLDPWLCLAEVQWLGGREADAMRSLALAKRCGAKADDVARYPRLAVTRSRPGYPFVSSP